MRKPWLACLSLLLACGKTESPRDRTSDAAAAPSASAVSATSTETFQTGAGAARTAHLVALWPVVHRLHAEDDPTRKGVAIELSGPGGEPAPSAPQILAQPDLATVADSLYVDHDGAP